MQKHAIVHVERPSADFERTKKFYGELFGWSFQGWDDQYLMFSAPDNLGGGFYKADAGPSDCATTVYVLVDEHDSYVQRVPELGGVVIATNQPVGQAGTFSQFKDPDGNSVGIWRPNP